MILRSPIWAEPGPNAIRRAASNIALAIALLVVLAYLTAMTLHSGYTPATVARAYAEERFARDWHAAWDLLCRSSRAAVGDYDTYAARSSFWYASTQERVRVSVGYVRPEYVAGQPAAAVAITVTSGGPIVRKTEAAGVLPVVLEDGQFRVCHEVTQRPTS